MFCGGLVDQVWEEFRLCRDQLRHHGLACENRSESIEFVLKVRIILALSHGDVRALRLNYSQDMVR
jgi:hypothetical protein